ncbi:hypothetical protein XI03_11235 [Bradyrhizobium sp. CCBAU 65884]|uniref:hypothetical protein n=1 Tax=Bradyrhizobium sp. CCBAU 65884 TaxID=722477 RepID=UPI002305A975|nr:hypothetical protein [Bradyrhizobium sp. CCBAU 65884]MDA9475062.1 hypothetical protein [Bradyrhizobium sp. CCBAU 65884]
MSGYLRLCFVSLVLVEILSTAPASSNPLADIFNTAAPQPAVTSPPQAECSGRPGNSTPDGQHWVYRMDGHRKCWFLTEGTAKVKKTVRRRAVKDSTASLDESGTARPRQSGVVDALAELLRSAPAEPSQPPHREVKVADAASGLDTDSALMSAALISAHNRQPTPTPSVPSQVDVEQLLAAALANDVVTPSKAPNMPIGVRIAEAGNEAASRTATWLGVLLMMLGMLSILSTSRSLRHAVKLRY